MFSKSMVFHALEIKYSCVLENLEALNFSVEGHDILSANNYFLFANNGVAIHHILSVVQYLVIQFVI